MPKEKKNNLSIFLIKKGIANHLDIIENIDSLNKRVFVDDNTKSIGTLYYPKSDNNPPGWLLSFFEINDLDVNFLNSNTRAIFITDVSNRTFVLVFGYGKNLLKKEVYEDDFGLLTTLNLVLPDTLKSIEKTDFSMSGKRSKEQLSAGGHISNFGIDIEQNLINEVTGKCKVSGLGNIVTGKESFHTKIPATAKNIRNFLSQCLDFYGKNDYKENFGWINNIRGVVSKETVEKLNILLVEKIKNETSEKIWLSIPEVINWSDIEGFKYGKTSPKQDEPYDDLFLSDLRNFISEDLDLIRVTDLKKYHIFCGYDFENKKFKKWSIYECLYCELGYKNDYYILSNSCWYKILNTFVSITNKRYKSIPFIDTDLPKYDENKYKGKGKGKGEQGYNYDVANLNKDYILFDCKNISIGGGKNKIEFCDLYSKGKKQIIHIKKYGGSNVFSHLFNQGLISAELLLAEDNFRMEVNNKIDDGYKFMDDISSNTNKYSIIFGIISGKKGDLDIPFFSKISLFNVYRRLKIIMNFKVYLTKILKSSHL